MDGQRLQTGTEELKLEQRHKRHLNTSHSAAAHISDSQKAFFFHPKSHVPPSKVALFPNKVGNAYIRPQVIIYTDGDGDDKIRSARSAEKLPTVCP